MMDEHFVKFDDQRWSRI